MAGTDDLYFILTWEAALCRQKPGLSSRQGTDSCLLPEKEVAPQHHLHFPCLLRSLEMCLEIRNLTLPQIANGWRILEFRVPHVPAGTWQLHRNTKHILHFDCHFFVLLVYKHSSHSTCFAEYSIFCLIDPSVWTGNQKGIKLEAVKLLIVITQRNHWRLSYPTARGHLQTVSLCVSQLL